EGSVPPWAATEFQRRTEQIQRMTEQIGWAVRHFVCFTTEIARLTEQIGRPSSEIARATCQIVSQSSQSGSVGNQFARASSQIWSPIYDRPEPNHLSLWRFKRDPSFSLPSREHASVFSTARLGPEPLSRRLLQMGAFD